MNEEDPIDYDSIPFEDIMIPLGDARPVAWEGYSVGVRFAAGDIADMWRPRPQPSWWRRAWHEASWRIPHAWRVLVHGECETY